MSEIKDPSIKLFGMMIQLGSKTDEDFATASKLEPSAPVSAAKDETDCDSECTSSGQNILCSKQDQNSANEKWDTEEAVDTKQEGEPSSNSGLEEPITPTSHSNNTENLESHTKDKMCSSQELDKKDQDQSDQTSTNSDSQDQNPLKKPDKIIPCPRCSSMDTKFCYFNNYNVNQPRHFCKNCQRYWTAGGSMRNVPVGAGRRKSKNYAASQQRHLVIPGHVMKPDGSVLAFGLDSSHPNQSKASVFTIGEGPQSFLPNGFFVSENDKSSSNPLSNSSSISVEMGGNCNRGAESYQAVPCFPYSWNPMPWQPGFPVSFYSTPLPQWGENLARPCNMQWLPNQSVNSDQSSTSSCSPNSTSLGKHSREGIMLMPSNSNRKKSSKEKDMQNSRVAVPKTLRFVDPSEASKSSISTILGNKNNNLHSSSSRKIALFGDLQQGKGINYERSSNIIPGIEASSIVLQANPAAFSRSHKLIVVRIQHEHASKYSLRPLFFAPFDPKNSHKKWSPGSKNCGRR